MQYARHSCSAFDAMFFMMAMSSLPLLPCSFLELSHFGPQEDPEGVARDVIAFFQCSRGPTLKQQDVVSCQVHMESVGKAGASLYQHKQPNFMSKM